MDKKELSRKIKSGINVWKVHLDQKQSSLTTELKKEKSELKVSPATLSKINTGKEEVSEGNLLKIAQAMDRVLEKQGYVYFPDSYEYLQTGEDGRPHLPENKGNTAQALGHLAGKYESYHLAKIGTVLLKTQVEMREDGLVKMWGLDTVYHGQARIFKENLLSVFFHEAENKCREERYPFYIHMIFHVGAYWQLAGDKLQHFFGVCSTISMDNEPMCHRRVWIKKEWEKGQGENIALESPEFRTLNENYAGLGDFLKDFSNNVLLTPQKVNEDFQM